ncbi:MAG: precorrin-3B synthase [Verrucomicrobia bacterium]|nr:precorrin-3B synthase [Verrucomicrobiota bacterium]MCH8528704.1 precorrin-3B synthase [Kiritimatiellia bacterium]
MNQLPDTPSPLHLRDLNPRQKGLLAMIQSLDPNGTHRLRIQCRGDTPWNIALVHSEFKLGQPQPEDAGARGLDHWDIIIRCTEEGRLPEGDDAKKLKSHGLFARPEEGSFMLRTRVPGCVIRADQCKGLADIAERYGDGLTTLTMRGNFQLRGLRPEHTVDALIALQEIGMTSIGSGANNVRNITASPTSGLDAHEVCDVRPLAKKLQHFILHHPELYNLPHKFNLAFDNGSHNGVFADKNDLSFVATRIPEGLSVPPGVYFRIFAGAKVTRGIRSKDAGVLVTERDVIKYATGIILLYKYRGDPDGRGRVRLNDLIAREGLDKVANHAAVLSDVLLYRLTADEQSVLPALGASNGFSGIHPEKTAGLFTVGVGIPVGRIPAASLRALGAAAARHGTGEIRLTAWQNCLIPHVPEAEIAIVRESIQALGFSCDEGDPAASLVACSGIGNCPYAATDAKGMGQTLISSLRASGLRKAVNININACSNACAHHTFGEIGLLGVKAGGHDKKAYHLFIGSNRPDEETNKPLLSKIPEAEVSGVVEKLVRLYDRHALPGESFAEFSARQGQDALRSVAEEAHTP